MRRSDLFQHILVITMSLQVLNYGSPTLYQCEKKSLVIEIKKKADTVRITSTQSLPYIENQLLNSKVAH